MKLPNWDLDKDLIFLKNKIKAKDSLWDIKVLWKSADPMRDQFESTGVLENLSLDDIFECEDGTFELYGKKVLVYIRDQYSGFRSGGKSYKFHIAHCGTITQFKNDYRYDGRYVASTRTDGKFKVNVMERGGKILFKDLVEEMSVCEGCLSKIYWHSAGAGYFTLLKFFERFKSTEIDSPLHTDNSQPLNIYPNNWSHLSKQAKHKAGYFCQSDNHANIKLLTGECPNKNKLMSEKNLETHHINSLKSDCRESNLIVLCEDCHNSIHHHVN